MPTNPAAVAKPKEPTATQVPSPIPKAAPAPIPKPKSLSDQAWEDMLGFGKRAGAYALDRGKEVGKNLARKGYAKAKAKGGEIAQRAKRRADDELRRRQLLRE